MTPTPDEIQRYAADPLAFIEDLIIPRADGSPARFGDCMADFQREALADLIPDLLAVRSGDKPPCGRHWWERTKGASKDSDLAMATLWLLAFTPRPLLIQVGAGDQDQASELRKAAKSIVYHNDWIGSRVAIQADRLLCEQTGATCEILTRDVKGSHGSRPDVLIVNELSHIGMEEFPQTLLDNARKLPRCLVVVATNAGFVGSQAWRWREHARGSDRWKFHVYAKPAPWMSEADIAEARAHNTPERVSRLLYGVWSTGEGNALSEADIQACLTMTAPPDFPDPYAHRIAGLDLALKRDRAAAVVLEVVEGSGRVRLVHVAEWTPSPATGQIDLIALEYDLLRLHSQWHLAALWYDPWGAGLLAQRLQQMQIRTFEMPFSAPNVDQMTRTLLEVITDHAIDLYPDESLLRDLRKLSIEEKQWGYRLTAPRDQFGHADTAYALCCALPCAWETAKTEPIYATQDAIERARL